MYAIYGNIYHEYTPNVSIYTSTMDPMGYSVASSSVGFWPLAIYFSMAWGLPDVRLDANEATARCEAWAGGAPFERMAEDPKKHGGFFWKHGGSSSINIRRKFRSQTSDNMDRWKAEQGRGREKRKIRRKKSRRERVRRKKMQMREKVGKSRNTVFFQCFVAPEGQKVGSLKRRGAEPAGQMRDEKLHAVVARSTFPSQNVQNTPLSDHFWKLRYRKVHAVVARSTFPSQNVQNTPAPDHCWQLRCWKSARRCGAKHISKSKCTKHLSVGPLWKLRCRKSARRCGAKHISKSTC